MVAPAVEQLRVMFCVEEYVPGSGLAVGVATFAVIVYAKLAVSLSVIPDLKALALMVVVADTWIGLVYCVLPLVGSLPLVV